jgi:hypothetical protein
MSFNMTAQVKDTPYFQEIKTTITLPEAAGKEIVKMFSVAEKQIVVTKSGISSRFNGSWTFNSRNGNWQTATIDQDGKLWLAMSNSIQTEDSKLTIALPETAKNDTILCLFVDGKTWFAGTTNGLYAYDNNFELISATKGKRIYAIAKGAKNDWWIGTDKGLLHQLDGKWVNLDDNLMANGLKQNYFSLASANNNQNILFGGLFSVGCIAANGNNWLFRGTDGLPYGPVTTIKPIANKIWIGTPNGAILKDESWHYYAGKRWLSNNKIIDILPIDRHTVWIATPEGISQIQEVQITLEEKAAKFEERIRLRHDRHGQVSKSVLKIPGDLTTSYTINDDNDGLWTSIYLGAECFRYAATHDPEARANAIKTFLALERMETVTGIPGFPARSFAAATDSVVQSRSPHPKKWHLLPDGKWQWLDDTSSDEIAGHLFSIPLFYELVADGELKNRSKELIHRIVSHIVDNNFHLIDFDGKPTRWAVWNPDSLNNSPNWNYEKNLNSLQILSFLKTAEQITHDPKFTMAYKQLVEKHHYAENTLEAKKFDPYENSHSDDLLAYLPYYMLFKYMKPEELLPVYKQSLMRSWNIAKPDEIPLWNLIASASLNEDCDVKQALEQLQKVPMDMISWTMTNSHRFDLQHDQLPSRFKTAQSVKPVPAPEGQISKWNTNPHQLDTGNGGRYEDDGSYFLLPYWMGRYHGYFTK